MVNIKKDGNMSEAFIFFYESKIFVVWFTNNKSRNAIFVLIN